MPCDSYMVVSKLLFSTAADDIVDTEIVKTLIKDIFDIRQAKLRVAIDCILKGTNQIEGQGKVSFNNLTLLEINSVRPFLPFSCDLVDRLERVYHQQIATLNDTSHSSSYYNSNRN